MSPTMSAAAAAAVVVDSGRSLDDATDVRTDRFRRLWCYKALQPAAISLGGGGYTQLTTTCRRCAKRNSNLFEYVRFTDSDSTHGSCHHLTLVRAIYSIHIYYLFIIKSYTKYVTDRHTVRTLKKVKAALNTIDKISSIRSRTNHVGYDNTPSRTIIISNSRFYNATCIQSVERIKWDSIILFIWPENTVSTIHLYRYIQNTTFLPMSKHII